MAKSSYQKLKDRIKRLEADNIQLRMDRRVLATEPESERAIQIALTEKHMKGVEDMMWQELNEAQGGNQWKGKATLQGIYNIVKPS